MVKYWVPATLDGRFLFRVDAESPEDAVAQVEAILGDSAVSDVEHYAIHSPMRAIGGGK